MNIQEELNKIFNNDPLGLLNIHNKIEDVFTCISNGTLSIQDLSSDTIKELALYLHKPNSVDVNTFVQCIAYMVEKGIYTEFKEELK